MAVQYFCKRNDKTFCEENKFGPRQLNVLNYKPPASKRKNPHTPLYMVSNYFSVCLSVGMLQTLNSIIPEPAKQNGLTFFRTSMAKSYVSKFFIRSTEQELTIYLPIY